MFENPLRGPAHISVFIDYAVAFPVLIFKRRNSFEAFHECFFRHRLGHDDLRPDVCLHDFPFPGFPPGPGKSKIQFPRRFRTPRNSFQRPGSEQVKRRFSFFFPRLHGALSQGLRQGSPRNIVIIDRYSVLPMGYSPAGRISPEDLINGHDPDRISIAFHGLSPP